MKEYICSICGYILSEAAGDPGSGIAPGTKWEDLPKDWVCPVCGASKDEFTIKSPDKPELKSVDAAGAQAQHEQMRELSFGELSALCSNLSKGCEKQYRAEEAECFNQLAAYYKGKSAPAGQKQFSNLYDLIQQNLNADYAQAGKIAAGVSDRGALRALVWGEKVTKILSSLLARYEKQKESMLDNTNIYVCEICGFVFVGNEAPEICPVCKVPRMKLQQIKREAV